MPFFGAGLNYAEGNNFEGLETASYHATVGTYLVLILKDKTTKQKS